mgnify:CR=1 FL=1
MYDLRSLKLLPEFLLVLNRVDTFRVAIIFSKFALFHMLNTSLPLGFTWVRTIGSDFCKLDFHRLLVDSRLPRLSDVRRVLRLQVLHCHHLSIWLGYELILMFVHNCCRSLLPDVLKSLLFVLRFLFALSEAHGWLLELC